MTDQKQICYLVKFLNFPVKRLIVDNHYGISKELEKMIATCKAPPEWIAREY